MAISKIDLFITQLANEKAPLFHARGLGLAQKYRSEIESKFQNHTISVNTITILGIKLCFLADFCRIKPREILEIQDRFANFADIHLHNLFSVDAINKLRAENGASYLAMYGYIAAYPFEIFEEHMTGLPVIPFISQDAIFGINTYLYALARGYVMIGCPANNASPAHQGMTRSFASVQEFLNLFRSQSDFVGLPLTYNSSIMGVAHDLTHLQGIRNLINPSIQYYELYQKHGKKLPDYDNTMAVADAKKVINCYRNIYLQLMKEWETLEKPEAVALLIYWLAHESAYGNRKGENYTADDFINASFSEVTRREMVIDNYELHNKPAEQREAFIRRAIVVNEFDFADHLVKLGFAIEINVDNPYVTLECMRKVFLKAYEASPQIKALLKEINENHVFFYGAPIYEKELELMVNH